MLMLCYKVLVLFIGGIVLFERELELVINIYCKLGTVAHACNPSTLGD